MKKNFLWQFGAIITLALLVSSCKKDLPGCNDENNPPSMRVFATGFNNPRGLKFGPDGYLYVAEGGKGGTNSTAGQCDQVPGPGPYTGSPTGGGISKVSPTGVRTTVTDQLPSSQTNPQLGSFVSGVADVAFIGNTLYAILSGAGCTHGVPSMPNSVLKVNQNDGTWALVANLSAWLKTHPVKNPEEEDFEPEGTWYSMIHVGNALYAVEPNHGELDKILTNGQVYRIADISESQGHIVPTALTYHDGDFYVGNLNTFPIVSGSSKVYRITQSGNVDVIAVGFTTILGLAFDKKGDLYILENTTGGQNKFPTPGTGKIEKLDKAGNRSVVIKGLSLPTAMTFGPDGNLYVSNNGFGPNAIGGGQVLQIDLHPGGCNIDDITSHLQF